MKDFPENTKVCAVCDQRLPVSEFYRHKIAADGLTGDCKTCRKAYVRSSRRKNSEHYKEYDRQRAKTTARKTVLKRADTTRRELHPERCRAHEAVKYAITTGKLLPQPCCVCGDAVGEAHHDDYTKPLDVRWLCGTHHREHHVIINEQHRKG